MSRPNLKRPNSAIFTAKTDSFVPNIRPMTNSQSMTQIDTLKENGFKIDNIQPIKKWTYLDNSNKNSSPRLPDRAVNINMDESSSDKLNLHAPLSKSSSLLQENARPFVFKTVVTKQNSVDSLINKLQEDVSAKTDYLVSNAKPITNSRSMTQIDSLKDGFKFDKTQPVKKWSYIHSSNTTPSCLPDLTTNVNMNESLSDKTNFPQYQPKSAPVIRENTSTFIMKNVATKQNSTDSTINKIEEDTEEEMKFQTFSAIQMAGPFQGILQTKATNEITTQRFMAENKETKKVSEVPLVNGKEENLKNPCLKDSESAQSISENTKETKLEVCKNNEKMWEDENFIDDVWKSYVERPLLPLKPLQKQKSLSCTNLVQTIKALSKKKVATNNRFSSPENTLFENKELRTSEANITNTPPRKNSVESADKKFQSLSDGKEPFTIKRERQSLQNYPWYHFVDAKEASRRLLDMHRNGAFLIRPASNPTSEVFHTLCVVCLGRVYNFHIRNLKDGLITLSKKKEQKETFSSLLGMIKYHQTVPITINLAGEVVHVLLLITPSK